MPDIVKILHAITEWKIERYIHNHIDYLISCESAINVIFFYKKIYVNKKL